MTDNRLPSAPNKNFEAIKKTDENNIEYWTARELMSLLGYADWSNFKIVIKKAMQACLNSGQNVDNHFREATKMVSIGYNTVRKIEDWKLDRYACYLIAQNGDSTKSQIALAQTYFAVQTRRQEIFDKLDAEQKRLLIRGEVSTQNKKLFRTAKDSGVSRFGAFNDAGYRGLYGMPLGQVADKKGIKKEELLDRAGSTELAANLFRITQTDEKLRKDKVASEFAAIQTHNMIGGKVRQTIKDIGGVMPEELPSERHIKDVKRDIKKLESQEEKKLKAGS
jgi:DNA-damage-inducible protein D